MNILVTVDRNYIIILGIMLKSLLIFHPDTEFDVYVLNTSLTGEDFETLKKLVPSKRIKLYDIKADDSLLADAPVTDRYPKEMYYRIFAASYLPQTIDRILYLDPDLVVIKPLDKLYSIDMGDSYFAAASHVGRFLTNVNALRLQMDDNAPYINSGVMMINLKLLRQEQNSDRVFDYIEKFRRALILPDQDVISGVYGSRIMKINPYVYNMNDRLLIMPDGIAAGITPDWVRENSAIIHYYGRNKPWKDRYIGVMGHYFTDIAHAPDPQ